MRIGRRIALVVLGATLTIIGCVAAAGRDAAGVAATILAGFFLAVTLDAGQVRRFLPGFSSKSRSATAIAVAGYFFIAGLLYGLVSGLLGPETTPLAPRSEEPERVGAPDQGPARRSMTVTVPGDPAFLATVVRVVSPDSVVLDGEETVTLSGVPSLRADDPAYQRAKATLESLVRGRVVAVEAMNPGLPRPGDAERLTVRLSVTLEAGQRPVSVNEAVLRAMAVGRRETR